MKCHSLVRGVVVCTAAMGESNSRVGIYTEGGLIYSMAYSARSIKSTVGGSNVLFTMGRFSLEESKGRFYKIYDIVVHEHCYALATSLPCYYTACVCLELVQYLHGAQHEAQFKVLVDVLLYLLEVCKREKEEQAQGAYGALLVYLFRSLCCNGWHPQALDNTQHVRTDYFRLDMGQGAFLPFLGSVNDKGDAEGIHRSYVDVVQQTLNKPFSYSANCVYKNTLSEGNQALGLALRHLFKAWHDVLERPLRTARFIVL